MRTREQKRLNISGFANYHEVLIPSSGSAIALSIYEFDKGAPCVVFLPGTMAHPLFYDDFLTKLAEKGFNVIGVHYASHGKSPRHKKIYTMEDLISNVKDAISFCTTHLNNNIVIMGSSQGGILSTAVGAADPRVRAVFAHNLILPSLKDTITITAFPRFLRLFYNSGRMLARIGAALCPSLPVSLRFYLDVDRITRSKEIQEDFEQDPIGMTHYPLRFLSSLMNIKLDALTDGSFQCPLVILAADGDELFSLEYTRKVYEKLVAPKKELIVFHEPFHLIFQECVDSVLDPIVQKLLEYTQ